MGLTVKDSYRIVHCGSIRGSMREVFAVDAGVSAHSSTC